MLVWLTGRFRLVRDNQTTITLNSANADVASLLLEVEQERRTTI